MPVLVSVDLGTTKITSLAVEGIRGEIVAHGAAVNDAQTTSEPERARGRSEWDALRIVAIGLDCLRQVSELLGDRRRDVVGIGITGQQHGMVLVDAALRPVTPLINWQDRRGQDAMPSGGTYVDHARQLVGDESVARTGCRLNSGFMGMTLFWLKQHGWLPDESRACFIMDLFAASLTGASLVTEPSCAGSSGLLNVRTRDWDAESIKSLGLSRALFPDIREANQVVGSLTREAAAAAGLPESVPVFAPIGDHQASFVGSVADRRSGVLVNVGTGAQVAVFTDGLRFAPPIELRPCPLGGNLLSNVGLAGGWSYQVLENFFRAVARDFDFGGDRDAPLYAAMNELAARVPPGADGLRCEPTFSGTRADPAARGSFTGLSPRNFTPAHMSRAVLEGMAASLRDGYRAIQQITGERPATLVAAGNGLRENAVLRTAVEAAFNLPLHFTRHREEAAFGAALTAAVGAGVCADLAAAGRLIAYTQS